MKEAYSHKEEWQKELEQEVNKKLAEVVPKQQQIRKELEELIKELEVDYHE